MARTKKKEYLNSDNARTTLSRGMNPAFSATHNVPAKDSNGKWGESRTPYTQSTTGRMSIDGRRAGGSTWTMTQKDDDGNKIRQSGRSKIATRRQRYYDVRKGLGLAGG